MAETPVAGARKTTGKRRKPGSRAPDTNISSVGLEYITSPQATPVQRAVPNIRIPEQPNIAKKFASLSTSLQRMQDNNARKYFSEAQVKASQLIDAERASGKSLKEIQENFAAGKYPQLKTQLAEDVFSSMYGETLANNYFNSPSGEGYKALEEWNQKFIRAPYEERMTMDFEKFLATQANNFRQEYGNVGSLHLLAGASKRMAVWREEQRKKHSDVRERRLDEDRIIAGSGEIRQDIDEVFRTQHVDAKGKKFKKYFSIEDIKKNIGPRIEQKVQQISARLGLDGTEMKRLKMQVASDIINNAWQEDTTEGKERKLEAAIAFLSYDPPGAPTPLVYDHSTYRKQGGSAGEAGNVMVSTHANNLITEAQKSLGKLREDQAISAAVHRLKTEINQKNPRAWAHQDSSNFDGTKLTRSKLFNLAIDSKLVDLHEVRVDGKRLSDEDIYARLIEFVNVAPRSSLSEGIAFFKTQVASLNHVYQKISAHAGKVDRDLLDDSDVNNFRRNFALFKALSKWSHDQLDKVFPPNSREREVMEFYNMDRMYGVATNQQGDETVAVSQGSGLKESMFMAYRNAMTPDAAKRRLTPAQIDDVLNDITGDIKNEKTGFWAMISDLHESHYNKHQYNNIMSMIRKYVKYKTSFGMPTSDIKDSVAEVFGKSLVAVEAAKATFFTPPHSPFRKSDLKKAAANYAMYKLEQFKTDNKYDGDLTFAPVIGTGADTDRYIILDRESGRPVILDNPKLSLNTATFQVTDDIAYKHAKGVLSAEIKGKHQRKVDREEGKINLGSRVRQIEELVSQGMSRSEATRIVKERIDKYNEEVKGR